MIEKLLPREVSVVESHPGDTQPCTLFTAEEAVIAGAAQKRRGEFTTVRGCAHRALDRMQLPPSPILPGTDGAPRWPSGVVGSMTHGGGYHAAAVARDSVMVTIGIDAEKDGPCPEGVLRAIALEAELLRHRTVSRAEPELHWDRLLFSAKESVYKAWYPITGRWLGFSEADITLRRDGTFTAVLLTDPPRTTADSTRTLPKALEGQWLAANGLLITAIAVPRAP